jgi:D-alanyl-D-alanine carboxypeptidase
MPVASTFVNAGKNGVSRDLAALASAILKRLKNDGHPGVSLVVSYRDTSIAQSAGWARLPGDAPALPMTEHVRYDMCSVSKPLTASAVLKLLLMRSDVSLESKIAPLLPAHWIIHPSRSNITFRHLLTHTSGIGTEARTYTKVRIAMTTPLEGTLGMFNYNGANYTLLRVLFAALVAPGANTAIKDDAMAEELTSAIYASQMQHLVFRPAGVPGATLLSSACPGLGYGSGGDPGDGVEFGDGTATAGPSGWHLTCAEAERVFRILHSTELILPQNLARKMADEQLGYDRDTATIDDVTWFTKGGKLDKDGATIKTRILCFTNGVTMMVIVNSGTGNALTAMTDEFKTWY